MSAHQAELLQRTEQLIQKRGEYQRLTDTHHPRSPEAARARQDIRCLEESLRTLKAIRHLIPTEAAA